MAQNYYDANGDLMVWTGEAYHRIPSIAASALGNQKVDYWDPTISNGDSSGGWATQDRFGLLNGQWSDYGLPNDQNNWMVGQDAGTKDFYGQLKSGDKEGTQVKFVLDQATGQYKPTMAGVTPWDTNADFMEKYGFVMPLLAGATFGLATGAMGAGAGAAAGAGEAAGAAAAPAGASWGLTGGAFGTGGAASAADLAAGLGYGGFTGATGATGAIPGMNASGGWGYMDPAAASGDFSGFSDLTMPGQGTWSETPNWGSGAPNTGTPMPDPTAGITGPGVPTIPGGGGSSIFSSLESALGLPAGSLSGASGALGGTGSGSGSGNNSNLGGILGGLLGGGLGYLDAKNQPDSLTIKNEIDPRLANLWYGADGSSGLTGQANQLLQQQLSQPNPLTQAGQQISGMANNQPSWNQLVDQGKSQWDANPWIQQQQKSITDLATRNLTENILPNIGSQANAAGGYGGSRQGIAQAKSISDMNTNLAPALTSLASNAWESGQNRALSSAQAAGSYGLNNQLQQAGLLGTGATMQANAPWNSFNQMANLARGAPGNTSTTQPLFNNTTAGAVGGANLGSQIGGGINWGDLFKTVGGWQWPWSTGA